MLLNLRVVPALKGDVYLDTVRIPKAHRQNLNTGIFYKISCENKTIYVALRGSEYDEPVIQIDDVNRMRLDVEEQQKYDFEIEPLSVFKLHLPLWYATNPYTRFGSRLGLIGFALSTLRGLQMFFEFACWIAHLRA